MAGYCLHGFCSNSDCDPNKPWGFNDNQDYAGIDAAFEEYEQQQRKRAKANRGPTQHTRYHDSEYRLEDSEWCKVNKCRSSCHGCNKTIASRVQRMGELLAPLTHTGHSLNVTRSDKWLLPT
jgi:hypothetical protein